MYDTQEASPASEQKKENIYSKLFVRLPKELVPQFKERRLETNIGRMYVFSIYIVVLQITLNIINIIKPSDSKGSDIIIYIVLSMSLLVIGFIYWFLFHQVRKGRIQSHKIKAFLVESLLYIYLCLQLVFCTLNILSTGGINSFIIAILIIGMVPIIRPLQSITSILLSFLYVFIALYLTRNTSNAWDSILLTDTWANLIIITGLTMCISVFIYDMYTTNFLKSVELQQANEALQNTNNQLENANEQLEVLANTDQMTGVANRRAFSKEFQTLWDLSISNNRRLALALVDIDFFKSYNDKFGHMEGDKCLQKIATSLKTTFRRNTDIVSRYGGEEFLIVFDANENNAFDFVELARKNIEALRIPHANTTISPYVTISAGVCVVLPGKDVSMDHALKIADDSLYDSKKSGRNKTTIVEYDETAMPDDEIAQ